jgi:hypothetical protein
MTFAIESGEKAFNIFLFTKQKLPLIYDHHPDPTCGSCGRHTIWFATL